MSRCRSTFVRGVFVGSSVATLLLIASGLVCRGISLSFYGRETNLEILAEGRSLLSLGGLPSALGVEGTTLEVGASYEKEPGVSITTGYSTSEEKKLEQPKKTLLTVVTTTRTLLERTSNRIRTSWGGIGTAEYRIVVGKEGSTWSTVDDPQIMVSAYHDFPAFPYLSISNLAALLDLVTSNFLYQYNWFLIAPSNVYVSVQSLERLLQGLNPYKVVYIGRPSKASMPEGYHYCEGGPGILFSHVALEKLKGRLQRCVLNSKGDLGYRELGLCMISELQTDCFMSSNVSCMLGKPLTSE